MTLAAPTVTVQAALQGVGTNHWRPGTQMNVQIKKNHTEPVTHIEYFVGSVGGGVVYWRPSVRIAATSNSTNETYVALDTLTRTVPQNVPLRVYARTFSTLHNPSAWGYFQFTSANSDPTDDTTKTFSPEGTVVTTKPTDALLGAAYAKDSNNDRIVAYRLQIERTGGSSWSYLGPKYSVNVSPGTRFNVRFPEIAAGFSYRWRLWYWDEAQYSGTPFEVVTGTTDVPPEADNSASPGPWHNFNLQMLPETEPDPGGGGPNSVPYFDSGFQPSPVGQIDVTNTTYSFSGRARFLDTQNKGITAYQVVITRVSDGRVMWDSKKVLARFGIGLAFATAVFGGLRINDHYRWKIRVWDDLNQVSDYSPEFEFWGVSRARQNQPPSLQVIGPTGTVDSLVPTFTGNFSDPLSTYNVFSSYRIEVQNMAGTQTLWNETFQTSNAEKTTRQFNRQYAGTPLQSGTQYRFRAEVYDDGGLGSGLSSWTTFTTQEAKPNPPISLSPQGTVLSLTPTFSGQHSHPNGVPMQHVQVQVYAKDKKTLIWDSMIHPASGSTFSIDWEDGWTVRPGAITPGTLVYYKARTSDTNGLWGNFSGFVAVTIQSTPNTPTNTFPPSSTTRVWPQRVPPVFAGNHRNPANTAMNAADVVVESSNFPVWTGNYSGAGPRFRIPYTQPLVAGEELTWKARTRAADTGFYGPYLDSQTLLINRPATTPSNLTPNGSNIQTLTPTLSWTPNVGDTGEADNVSPSGRKQVFAEIDIVDQATGTSVPNYPRTTAEFFDTFDTFSGWTQVVGTWSVSNGKLVPSATSNALIVRSTSAANGYIGAYVKYLSNAQTGLAFRYMGSANYMRLVMDNDSLKLQKIVSGVTSDIASASVDIADGYEQHLALYLNGPVITAYLNGQQTLVATDSFVQGQANHGLYANGTSAAAFDDMYVASATAGQNSHTVLPGSLNFEKTYAYRIRTYDGFEPGAWSAPAPFTTVDAPQVTITAPTAGMVLGSPNVLVQWDYVGSGGRPQAQYRVQVFQGTTPVYTSQTYNGTDTELEVPIGYLLNGGDYRPVVQVWDTLGIAASSSPVDVTTAWTPSPSLDDFNAVAVDDEGYILLSWEQSNISTVDFSRYEIRRFLPDGTSRGIAHITDESVTSYRDYFAPANVVVSYSLIQVRNVGNEEVPSGEVSATARLHFSGEMWVNDFVEPDAYAVRLYDSPSRQFTPNRDEEDIRYWGAQKPTRHTGFGLWKTFTVGARIFGPDHPVAPTEDDSEIWRMLETLYRRGNAVCYRDARGRRLFANFSYSETDEMPHQWQVSLTLTEADVEEGFE